MSNRSEAELREEAMRRDDERPQADENIIYPDTDGDEAFTPTAITSYQDTIAVIAVPVTDEVYSQLRLIQRVTPPAENGDVVPLYHILLGAFERQFKDSAVEVAEMLMKMLTKADGNEENKD